MKKQDHKPAVIAVHLLNDFSGSPFVFKQALQVLLDQGMVVHLLTATPSGTGFLSDLKVKKHPVFYKWQKSKMLTFFFFFYSQFLIFLKTLAIVRRGDIIYINTMLPFGAAVAGKLKGNKVIYHIHEVSVRPALLKKFLLWIMRNTADQCIYVSKYVSEHTRAQVPRTVIYNALPKKFIELSKRKIVRAKHKFSVLMLCSLKKYKGVLQYLQCARRLPDYEFVLVLNANEQQIGSFFKEEYLPSNLKIYAAQSDVHPYYLNASVVVNLSQPPEWIETFGMTALEAMYYGKPVIVPAAGGIMEIVTDQVSGFHVDPSNIEEVCTRIELLASDEALCQSMGESAFAKADRFTPELFKRDMLKVFNRVLPDEQVYQTSDLMKYRSI